MEDFYERLAVRAASIDELLSDDFEPLPGQKSDADTAGRRLTAWCKSSASGDWALFERRLERDGVSIGRVLPRLATVRRRNGAPPPAWIEDAIWIEAALRLPGGDGERDALVGDSAPCAFEHLIVPVVGRASALLRASATHPPPEDMSDAAHRCLCGALLQQLSDFLAPALYERFLNAKADSARDRPAARYDRFVGDMRTGGFRRLFEDKPVLLRLLAVVVRQWIDASGELLARLSADLPAIRRGLQSGVRNRITTITGDVSDPHNLGRTVQIIGFEDGSRVVYKPKDLRLDAAWREQVEQLNRAGAPVELRAVRVLPRDGYGWTEFIEHRACDDVAGPARFFRRIGAWLALFHCFASADMHQENMIATGDHPVPIDLEMILQAAPGERETEDAEARAFDAASEMVANSVMAVGLLPAYAKAHDNRIVAIGGVTSNWTSNVRLRWHDINTDAMQPFRERDAGAVTPNLPHVNGRYARLGDHIDDVVSGFEDYATFLMDRLNDPEQVVRLERFAGLPVRRIVRPTRFYGMLLQRLRDHRWMDDGATWSAQADFVARLSDWDLQTDHSWALQRAERSALVALNIPHFLLPSDGGAIADATGISAVSRTVPGLVRARMRVCALDAAEIAWQVAVIRENTGRASGARARQAAVSAYAAAGEPEPSSLAARAACLSQAGAIAADLARHAIREGPGAGWIGLDWIGDTDVSQLIPLGPDLYNGAGGIALFLAAHGAVTGEGSSKELARAALAYLRKNLRSRNAPRMARTLGIGGATGLGSIVYALTAISRLLGDDTFLDDAHAAAELLADDLIAADKQLDVMSGSAGAVMALLRLYRETGSNAALGRAVRCGAHLLAQRRGGMDGARSWIVAGSGTRPLNGMSHGAAGFALAMASLASASGHEEFALAAAECLAFENASYDAQRHDWPDAVGDTAPLWRCRWCHGAVGIGLARLAMLKCEAVPRAQLETDIERALASAERSWPGNVDHLCCGSLGTVEFLRASAGAFERDDLRELASRRLMQTLSAAASRGDFRWSSGQSRFNLGLFRGLAGVGYTTLREIDRSLPNVLIWE